MGETYLTVKEVARRLGVTRQSVYNWIADGRLKAVRVGGTAVRIAESSLSELIQPIDADERASDEEAHTLQEAA